MRVLHRILVTFLIVVGLSMAAWGQKGQEKPKPTKPTPPVVTPQPKPPPDTKPKKPGMAMVVLAAVGKIENV